MTWIGGDVRPVLSRMESGVARGSESCVCGGGGIWSLIYMDDGYSCCDTDMVGEYWVDGC